MAVGDVNPDTPTDVAFHDLVAFLLAQGVLAPSTIVGRNLCRTVSIRYALRFGQ